MEVVEAEPGLLLGAGGGPRVTVTVRFGEGDLLLGYTDGLVEASSAGPSAPDRLDAWLADVVEQVRDTRRDDDVAVLALLRLS